MRKHVYVTVYVLKYVSVKRVKALDTLSLLKAKLHVDVAKRSTSLKFMRQNFVIKQRNAY